MHTRCTIILVLALLAAFSASAADEMKKLDFLVGEWEGEGWVQMGPGKKEYVFQYESVQTKLGGKVLLIDGLGKRKLENGSVGEVVHEALAVVSWDDAKKVYRFEAYTVQQGNVDATLDVRENGAVWGFDTPQGGKVRYTITRTEKGEWNEVGEFSRDGTKWMKFFEMTLQKVK